MTEYLRREKDRRDAILNDRPDTKFYFKSQDFLDLSEHARPKINNFFQQHAAAVREVRKCNNLIEAAAERYSIDPDIVRAIIYTEVSRGWFYGKPAQDLGGAKTLYPGNISRSWQDLIPGSNVENDKDNIELTTMLISRIAKRLDDPSIENIYSLYNSLSHDRTYVNKETKSTPYFAKLAMEERAWEKESWEPPELPKSGHGPARQDSFSGRFGNWVSSPASAAPPLAPGRTDFDDRFGDWGSAPSGGSSRPSSPVIRELLKYKRSALPDAPAANWTRDLSATAFQEDPRSASDVPNDRYSSTQASERSLGAVDPKPLRYLTSRIIGKPAVSVFDAGAPAVPHVADENFEPGRPASFDGRFGNWVSSPPVTAPRGPYQPQPAQQARSRGIVSGEPMPDWPFPPPFFEFPNKSAPRGEDRDDWLVRLLRGRS